MCKGNVLLHHDQKVTEIFKTSCFVSGGVKWNDNIRRNAPLPKKKKKGRKKYSMMSRMKPKGTLSFVHEEKQVDQQHNKQLQDSLFLILNRCWEIETKCNLSQTKIVSKQVREEITRAYKEKDNNRIQTKSESQEKEKWSRGFEKGFKKQILKKLDDVEVS